MNASPSESKIGLNQQTLYLIYLVFLFIPWLFYPPEVADVIATLVAAGVFIPLHFQALKTESPNRINYIAAIATIGVAMAPFQNGYSVFHIYAVAAAGYLQPLRVSRITLGVCIIAYVGSGLLFDRYSLEIVAGLMISIIVWTSSLADAQLHATHEQAERERTLDSQHASLVERERIARDLHDLLGHTLTLVSLKADLAGRLIDTDPASAKSAIEDIQSSSRQALADIRATLKGVIATSSKQEIANAKAALRAAGIELTLVGTPPELLPDTDSVIGLTIREAITNVVRHSSATAVTISFNSNDISSGVTITDNGESLNLTEGTGLSGLRARLEAIGGILSVGKSRLSDSGIQIQATLPA